MEQTKYEVTVGNLGSVIETESYEEAKTVYDEYVWQSSANYGRVAGEWVTLWEDGEPLEEHHGSYNTDEY